MEKNELIAYAMDFASYLVSKIKEIDRIILHGSVTRGDFDENSDVDLFIEVRDKKTDKKITNITEDYYKTKKFNEWKLKGIENPISVITGSLDSKEWKDLKRAIINTGFILYGKYKEKAEKTNQYVLFSFENIKPDNRRVSIFRKLFGFKVRNKRYFGLTDNIGAIKIGKGCILVPIEHGNKVKSFFQNEKVKVRLYDLWSDSKI